MADRRPLLWSQIRHHNRIFWRTPIAAFFTLVFPLMLLLLFMALFGARSLPGSGMSTVGYFVPGLAVFAAVSATYTNLAVGTAIARDNGVLKRVRGTPLPPWVYLSGRVGSAVYLALVGLTLMMAVGVVGFGLTVPLADIPGLALVFVAGVACFSALGLLVAALSPSGESAPAVANATLLPVAFVSDVFFPVADPPVWMTLVGEVFPLRSFVVGFRSALLGDGLDWYAVAHLMAWGVVAAALAIRVFRWDPAPVGRSRGRRIQSGG